MDLIKSVPEHRNTMTENLIYLSELNSHSYNLTGLAQVSNFLQALVKTKFEDIPKCCELEIPDEQCIAMNGGIEVRKLGKALSVKRIRPEAKTKILFCGHMDTVFPIDSSFQRVAVLNEELFAQMYPEAAAGIDIKDEKIDFERLAERDFSQVYALNGPGVADLKGGLMVMIKTLELLEESDIAKDISWEILINPDEEIGSPGSTPLLKEVAERNEWGLVYEPALADGSMAFERKGSGNYTIIAKGKPAHVGRAFDEGRSAIAAIAQVIAKGHELNKTYPDSIINFGLIQGGSALNVVPEQAVVKFNIRVTKDGDDDLVIRSMQNICDEVSKETGVDFELNGKLNRKPKNADEKMSTLFKIVEEACGDLGLSYNTRNTGGCCDGNNLAEYGLANIDTLGVRGAYIHSAREYMIVDSLIERVQLSLAVIEKLHKHACS